MVSIIVKEGGVMFSYISCIRIIPIVLAYLKLPCKKEIDEDLIHIYGKSIEYKFSTY